MSRSFWTKNESPVNASPSSHAAGPSMAPGAAQTSFKTNVNRQKTKRWVEAKSYSYDGDDWGDVDDYDEYGAQAAVPPPVPKPTGMRQKGQGVASPAPTATIRHVTSAGSQDTINTPHGSSLLPNDRRSEIQQESDWPSMRQNAPISTDHANDSQPSAATQFTHGPTPSEHPPPGNPVRSSSEVISQTPERSYEQPLQGPPPLTLDTGTRFYEVENIARNQSASRQPFNNQNTNTTLSMGQAPGTSLNQGVRQVEASISPVYLQDRTSGAASTALAPSYMSSSPATEAVGATSTGGYYPPRKSSLTHPNPINPESPAVGSSSELRGTTPQPESSNATMASRPRASSHPQKPLPFVRPADIYKRIEEERERERRSLDSDRRSMDSARSKVLESESPRRGKGIDEQPGSDRISYSPELETSRRAAFRLQPVRELKSESGLDNGIGDNGNTGAEAEGVQDPFRGGGFNKAHAPSLSATGPPATDPLVMDHPSAYTATPILPDLARLSGFGDNLWSSSQSNNREGPANTIKPSPQLPASQIPHVQSSTSRLPGEAADGFRSVVDQAFELSEARSASQTPSAAHEKQGQGTGGEPKRSESASTAGISPIMSRVPAAATFEERLREDGASGAAKDVATEERPVRNIAAADQTNVERTSDKTSLDHEEPSWVLQAPRSESASSPSRSSRYDHTRNLSTSSVNRSPARSAVIAINDNLPDGETVEVDATSPIDSGDSVSAHPGRSPEPPGLSVVTGASEMEGNSAVSRQDDDGVEDKRDTGSDVKTAGTLSSDSPTRIRQSPTWSSDAQRSRAGSPTKGRVRDLAGKFESQAASTVSATSSPKRGSYSELSKAHEDIVLQRPPPPTSEVSFRPAMPGSWISYHAGGNATSPSDVQPRGSKLPEAPPKQANTDTSAMHRTDGLVSTDEEHPLQDAGRESLLSQPAYTVSREKVAEAVPRTRGDSLLQPEHAAAESENLTSGREKSNDLLVSDANLNRSEESPPAPPPKDTASRKIGLDSDFGHLTHPLTPRKLETGEPFRTPAHKIETNAMIPAPSMSTDASPDDQESDKLRKEIVRSLNSPALPPSPLDSHSEAQQSDFLRVSLGSSHLSHGRDSNILPSEYDSYWASTRDREDSEPLHSLLAHQRDSESENRQLETLHPPSEAQAMTGQDLSSTVDEPSKDTMQEPSTDENNLSAHHIPSVADSTQGRASTIFGANVPPLSGDIRTPDSQPIVTISSKQQHLGDPAGSSFGGLHSQAEDVSKTIGYNSSVRDALIMTPADRGGGHDLTSNIPTPVGSSSHPPHEPDLGQKPMPLEQRRPSSTTSNKRRSISRDSQPRASEHETSSRDQEGVQLDYSGGLHSGSLDQLIHFTESEPAHLQLPTSPRHSSEANPILQTGEEPYLGQHEGSAAKPPEPVSKDAAAPAALNRVPTFQEISAMTTPSERIKAYNSVRAHYANMDTGLAVWVASMTSRSVSHGGMAAPTLDTTWVPRTSSPKSSSSQSKTSYPSPTPSQPYYQQYLSFSDLSPSTRTTPGSTSKPLPVPGTITSQSSTPSGGRVTSGQVQAKGKELLHSAGILGGKANVAAKGLFAKGKSKWRASGTEKSDH
ncbi:MAG: hypothetical protein M1816_004370 [Peltula sp. TS41687]|nr:MAG: hypothetical protein M1816_004370 [Peltula sp. TS41687]